jgi:hypothetical protein
MYVELKSGYGDNGPAWIDVANTSKSGSTIYSNGKAFKSLKGSGIGANYFDIESGEEYWISGVKKNNQDRHWAGGGDILINTIAVKRYLEEMRISSLPRNLIPSELEAAKQKQSHIKLEHRLEALRSTEYSGSIASGRSSSMKRKF